MDMSICIDRFLSPQETAYSVAVGEVRAGRKVNHWMWYIFPQIRGMGQSTTAWYYGIEDLAEAKSYYEHPVLGPRLREITQVLLELPETDPVKIFGRTDSMKLHSSMTLFSRAIGDGLFAQVLDKYYRGEEDETTLQLLAQRGTPL